MKNILVTGGAGFIGSNFIRMIVDKYPEYNLINIDLLTYAGCLENLANIEEADNYTFFQADIRKKEEIECIFNRFNIDIIINFAAESHVDRSIEEPNIFLTTNILGTQVLLDLAKEYWKINKEDNLCREFRKGVKFLQISTDEVYGSLGKEGKFTETTPLQPNSPYSASKASADLIVRAYHETYGLPINISRCSNNYGPYQFPEKLIPLTIYNCINNIDIPVYGDGMQIRDWLHVLDHCEAIDTIIHKGKIGEIYNVGGNNEKKNIEIVHMITRMLDKSADLIKFVNDRPGHDRRYAIDNTKIKTELGWEPKYTFEVGLQDTIKWYQDNMQWLNNRVIKKNN